jgi:carbamate kinase
MFDLVRRSLMHGATPQGRQSLSPKHAVQNPRQPEPASRLTRQPSALSRRVLVAIGGNALLQAGEPASVEAQRQRLDATGRALAGLAASARLVITHGNGPQVGAALLRSELSAGDAYPLPLDVCVASTQGEIGFLLEQAVGRALAARRLGHSVATVLAQVVVAADDPGFARPTKPIGPFYPPAEAGARRRLGWAMIEDPRHGYRRVVASPEPLEIVEEASIRTLVDAGTIVITLGGGGIPVLRRGRRLDAVEAVVDKDLSSALLAIRLQMDRLVIVTDVDRIYLDFGRPKARGLNRVTVGELRRHAAAGHFPPGTMGPKVEAALRFVEATGGQATVTSSDRLTAALGGRAGTHLIGNTGEDDHEPYSNADHGSRRSRLPQLQRGLSERFAL